MCKIRTSPLAFQSTDQQIKTNGQLPTMLFLSQSIGNRSLHICLHIGTFLLTSPFCLPLINPCDILQKWIIKRGSWSTRWNSSLEIQSNNGRIKLRIRKNNQWLACLKTSFGNGERRDLIEGALLRERRWLFFSFK